MKVLLIAPKIHSKPSAPPLGLAYLAAVAREAGYKVAIIDNELEQLAEPELGQRIEDFGPDVLGITSNIMSMNSTLRIAELAPPGCRVVFGGPQPSLNPENYLQRADYLVLRGESEASFPVLLRHLEKGQDISRIKGLSWVGQNGEVVSNPPEDYIKDISSIPHPAYDALRMEGYTHSFEGGRCSVMLATRGCPFKCIYCYHILNNSYRVREPEELIAEIRLLQEDYGINRIKFFDDNFTLNRKSTVARCQAFIDQGLDIKWQCLSRVDHVDEDLLSLMHRAGCRHISFGVESGSQKTLDRIKKGTTIAQNRRALELCRRVGIRTKTYLMIGFPWETKEDIEETIRFVEETVPDYIQVLMVTPMPNTEMELMFKAEGVEMDDDKLASLEKAPDFILPMVHSPHWTLEELQSLYSELHRRYQEAGGRGGKDKIGYGGKGRGLWGRIVSRFLGAV